MAKHRKQAERQSTIDSQLEAAAGRANKSWEPLPLQGYPRLQRWYISQDQVQLRDSRDSRGLFLKAQEEEATMGFFELLGTGGNLHVSALCEMTPSKWRSLRPVATGQNSHHVCGPRRTEIHFDDHAELTEA